MLMEDILEAGKLELNRVWEAMNFRKYSHRKGKFLAALLLRVPSDAEGLARYKAYLRNTVKTRINSVDID